MDIAIESSQDLITRLGYLCLGSRLKRLGERMQSGVAQLLLARGHDVQPAQLTMLWALEEAGPLTIGVLSERIGVSQPGVSRAIAALEAEGLVGRATAGRDKRQRCYALTDTAQVLMADLAEGFFPAVDAAVAQLCAAEETDLLKHLAAIEDGLAAEPLETRIIRAEQARNG
jgi:DNA-binding MarR family transcriptional regulator